MKKKSKTEIILDSIADGVFTVDEDQNITSFNNAAEKITGVSRNQAIGQKCFDVFRADICQSDCALKKTMTTGEPLIDQRINILDSSGTVTPISISTAMLKNEEGKIIGGVETFRDLSTVEQLRKEINSKFTVGDIVSKSDAIQRIFDVLPDIASSEATVLIEGASGTGKELFARAIHNLSDRKQKKLVTINCGALPDTLLESELFGYVKGAFTDAKKDKPGRFQLARGGTIFLDEIGDISTALQVKLLRVLQEKEFEPLGATQTVKADVRIIAATNKKLNELVARGIFREDLYYRLNVVKISLPTLDQRREDIPLLVEHFIRRFNDRTGKNIQGLSQEAMSCLMGYNFPGNIRELENIIEHAFVLCRENQIAMAHLPADLLNAASTVSDITASAETDPMAQNEARLIRRTLEKHHGNRRKTAEELGIHKTTLWRKMKKLKIS
ncbi:MAG: sigma 54-interacting transcriptional regulator [Thermodesulfobacteriota bacterium]|nr:sigma 54-interacting transcriptional regulator [Thermodesulfobacteriota bacterium]